jgi:hypothetical protein
VSRWKLEGLKIIRECKKEKLPPNFLCFEKGIYSQNDTKERGVKAENTLFLKTKRLDKTYSLLVILLTVTVT